MSSASVCVAGEAVADGVDAFMLGRDHLVPGALIAGHALADEERGGFLLGLLLGRAMRRRAGSSRQTGLRQFLRWEQCTGGRTKYRRRRVAGERQRHVKNAHAWLYARRSWFVPRERMQLT